MTTPLPPDRIALLEKCPPPEEASTDTAEVADIGLLDYKPYSDAQRAFHESMAKYKWLRGGLGSGKTRASIEQLFLYLCTVLWHLPVVSLVASETYRHLMDDTVPVLRKVFPPEYLKGNSWDKAFRRQDMALYLNNGSVALLRTANNKNYERWRGPEFASFVMNEGRNTPTRNPWVVGIGRLRYPGVPESLLMAWNGSTTNGHDWQYDEFHGKFKTENHADFLMKTSENPHLPSGYYDNLRASMDEDEARQELDGEFLSRQGAVYPMLSIDRWPNGNILYQPQDRRVPTDVVIDWGYRSPRCLFVQQRRELAVEASKFIELDVVAHEWQGPAGKPIKNKTVGDMIEWLQEMRGQGWNLSRIFCDPAGDAANDQEHITSAQQVHRATGLVVHYPTKPWQRSKVNGEKTVRARVRSADGVRHLVWAADPDSDSNAPRVYASNCFDAHRNLLFPEDRDNQAEKDVSHKDGVNDHDTDALRYHQVMLHGRERVLRPWEVLSGMR